MMVVQPLWLLLVLLIPIPWLFMRRRGYVGYSDTSLAEGISGSTLLARLPLILFSLAIICAAIALARPQRLHVETTHTLKARDILIGVDISGSMESSFDGHIPPREGRHPAIDKELPQYARREQDRKNNPSGPGGSAPVGQRKIDAAKYAVQKFVEDRFVAEEGDRIGIFAFDTMPRWSWPITHDLKMIFRKAEFIDEGIGGGTNFGDMKPGPIDAAGEHFEELGQSVTKVLILVTDGDDSLSPDTMERLEALISQYRIHLYIIGVGETLAERDVDIMRLTWRVDGQVFRVENTEDLTRCFGTIEQLERSVVESSTSESHEEIFYYFAAAAALFFFFAVLGEAVVLSQ